MFYQHLIPLLTADLEHDEDYLYNLNPEGRQIHFESVLDTEFYFGTTCKSKSNFFKRDLDLIIAPAYKPEIKRKSL
jgi:hypothetical protein